MPGHIGVMKGLNWLRRLINVHLSSKVHLLAFLNILDIVWWLGRPLLALHLLLNLFSLGSPLFADFLWTFDGLDIIILIYCSFHL